MFYRHVRLTAPAPQRVLLLYHLRIAAGFVYTNPMEETPEQSSNTLAYIVGAVALVLVLGAAFFLRPKQGPASVSPQGTTIQASPTPGAITALGCDTQYYNPKIAFNEYYLSVEGGNVSSAETVSCTFTASVAGEIAATTTVESPLTAAPERGGATFKCTTEALPLDPNIETVISVALTDDLGASSSCSASFFFPPGL